MLQILVVVYEPIYEMQWVVFKTQFARQKFRCPASLKKQAFQLYTQGLIQNVTSSKNQCFRFFGLTFAQSKCCNLVISKRFARTTIKEMNFWVTCTDQKAFTMKKQEMEEEEDPLLQGYSLVQANNVQIQWSTSSPSEWIFLTHPHTHTYILAHLDHLRSVHYLVYN